MCVDIPLQNHLTTLQWFTQHITASGLRLLFHPNSGDTLVDHRDRGIWMKSILPLVICVGTNPAP